MWRSALGAAAAVALVVLAVLAVRVAVSADESVAPGGPGRGVSNTPTVSDTLDCTPPPPPSGVTEWIAHCDLTQRR